MVVWILNATCWMMDRNVTLVVLFHLRYEAEFQKTYLDKMRGKVWNHPHVQSTLHTPIHSHCSYLLLSTHPVYAASKCRVFSLCFSPAAWVGSEAAAWRQVSFQQFNTCTGNHLPVKLKDSLRIIQVIGSPVFDYEWCLFLLFLQWHCWVLLGHHAQNRWAKTLHVTAS